MKQRWMRIALALAGIGAALVAVSPAAAQQPHDDLGDDGAGDEEDQAVDAAAQLGQILLHAAQPFVLEGAGRVVCPASRRAAFGGGEAGQTALQHSGAGAGAGRA